MSWKLAIFGISIMLMVCSGEYLTPDVGILSITRQLPTKEDGEKKLLKVCTSTELADKDVFLGIEVDHLDGNPAVERTMKEYAAEEIDDTKCRFYEGDILGYESCEVTFLLQVTEGTPIVISAGSATFKIPDAILEESSISKSQLVGGNTLRLAVSDPSVPLTDWEVCANSLTHVPTCEDPTTTCYVIEIAVITEYSLCIKDSDPVSNAILNTAMFKGVIPIVTPENPEEVLLTYATPKSKLKVTSAKFANKLEFVPYNKVSKEEYTFCSGSATDCSLTGYKTEKDKMINIIIMSVDIDNGATTSQLIEFKDYEIGGVSLGQKIIELYWENNDQKTYGAHLDESARINQNVIVDCSDDSLTYCYAYFAGLTPGQNYHATFCPASNLIWPDGGNPFDPIDINKIQPKQIKTDPEVRNQEVTLLDSISDDGILQVCYEVSASANNTNRHELIIIDEGGHWIKIHQSSQGRNQTQCFAPVNLLLSSLEVTKDSKVTAVFVERELIGNKVLASSQKDINISAVRAIKPEVDNGSNGSTSTLAIVGAAIGGIACLMALVAAAIMFVMKIKRDNDGIQYPLHRTNIEQDSSYIHGLDNSIPTM